MNDMNASVAHLATQQDEGIIDTIDIREIVSVLIGSWPVIAIVFISTILIAQYSLFLTSPTYQTDALVQVESTPTVAEAAIGELQQGIAPEMFSEAEIELLRSRSTLIPVIENLGLDIEARPKTLVIFGQALGESVVRRHSASGYGSAPLWLKPFNDPTFAWGGEIIRVTRLHAPQNVVGTTIELTATGDDRFSITHPALPEPALGTVGEELRIPADQLLNAESDFVMFVQELQANPGTGFYVQKLPLNAAISAVQNSFSARESSARGIIRLEFTGESPTRIVKTLDSILRTYQTQHIERRSEQAQLTLEFLDLQLPTLRERVEIAEARLNQYRIERGTADLDRETAALLEQNLGIEQQLSELRQRKQEALQRFTDRHPIVVSIDSQINELNEQLALIEARVTELPDVQQQVLALVREVEVATTLYTALLNRKQEFEMVRAGTTGSIRIIDTPMLPRYSVKPNRQRTTLSYGILGIFAGVGLVLVLFYFRSGVDDPVKVEKKIDLPNYGSIPYSALQQSLVTGTRRIGSDSPQLLSTLEPESTTTEAIRSLRRRCVSHSLMRPIM